MKALFLLSVAVVAVVGACGWLITRRWIPDWTPAVLCYCAAVNLVGCWLSFVPIAVARRRRPDYLQQAALGGILVRMIVAGTAALLAMTLGPWASFPLSVWMIVFYLSLLAVETVATLSVARGVPHRPSQETSQ